MKMRKFTTLIGLLLLIIALSTTNLKAQWSGAYGNEWLAGKYDQSWLRIGVSAKGIHRIAITSLPSNFQTADKTRLQLWHRGNQVDIIKADDSEILFYGIPNDGASDELLYRLPTSRKNPYFSTFSIESAYFLTIGSTAGNRAVTENLPIDNNIEALQFHIKTYLKTYQNEYTHTTQYSTRPTTLNSYFEEGKTGTGTAIPIPNDLTKIHTSNPKSIQYSSAYVPEPFSFEVNNLYGTTPPTVKMLLSGRYGNAQIDLFVGKLASPLRTVTTLNTVDFRPLEYSFQLSGDDFDQNGGTLGFRSTVNLNYFSVTYFTVTYNQLIDMQNLNSYEFNFPAVAAGTKSRFAINNPSSDAKFYDISKTYKPRIIAGNTSNLMISRDNLPLKLLGTNEITNVLAEKISSVTFENINPGSYDYLIVSNEVLYNSATQYSGYRKNLSPGKKYKPLVKKIKDIYNQFNYGEPSPVAIRRFVDYMISNGDKNKFLLLIGKSVTKSDRVVMELPEEVPTVGFPGSDLLLVDGLAGTPDDVPAIPVGRISAITPTHVTDYLAKVVKYENQKDLSWRKNVLHYSGGKDQNEIDGFAGYLSTIGASVTNSPYSGTVLRKVKTIPRDEREEITLAPELNGNGLGMISYFGHGSTYRTDLNAGYATDNDKGYNNPDKYPVLFYNGCGVGNIFSNLFAETVNTSTSRPMSLDWLLAPNKGAIIVFGNDWDAYASNSNEYLDRLYPLMFSKTDAQRGTIGQILQEVAAQTKIAKGYTYTISQNARVAAYYDADRANIHQVLLQGDPALRILLTESALPVDLVEFNAKAVGESKVSVTWKTASEKDNSHFIIERSYNAKNFENIGYVEGKGDSNSEVSYNFSDNKPLSGTSYYRLKQVDKELLVDGKYEAKSTYSRIVSVVLQNTSSPLIVSPNPVLNFVNIELSVPVSVKTWNLVDLKGRVIRKNGTGTKIDLSNLVGGEYIIEVTTDNGDVYTKKIIKQ